MELYDGPYDFFLRFITEIEVGTRTNREERVKVKERRRSKGGSRTHRNVKYRFVSRPRSPSKIKKNESRHQQSIYRVTLTYFFFFLLSATPS